ncbi:MAG: Flp family type IVb pilin [Alphaproteobacteria bacterium]
MLNKLFAWKEAYLKDEDGATAIEYGLIAAGIAVAIAAVVGLTGDALTGTFETVNTSLE